MNAQTHSHSNLLKNKKLSVRKDLPSPGRHVRLVTAVAEDEANDFKLRQCSISLYFYLPKREHPPSAKKKLQTLHCTLQSKTSAIRKAIILS